MARNISAIRDIIRGQLRDQFKSDDEYDWPDDELDQHIIQCLAEVSEESPYEVRETLYIEARTGRATATTASHLVDTTKNQFLAADVGKVVYNTVDKTTATIIAYAGAATATTADHLIDTTKNQFVASDVGKVVHNTTDGTTAIITNYNSPSDLTLDTDIMTSGETYEIHSPSDVLLDTDIMTSGETYEIYCAGGTSQTDVDTSSITDLVEVEDVEYPTRQPSKELRNFEQFGDVLTIDYEGSVTDGDEVFLYCGKLHELTEDVSTLRPPLERLLVDGTVAYAAIAWVNSYRRQVSEAIEKLATSASALGSMTARISQAVTDLNSGRALINKVGKSADPAGQFANSAASELGTAGGYLNQGRAHLEEMAARLSIGDLINTYQRWATNKLALYKQELAKIAPIETSRVYPKQ